jgi:predicted PurR-regulated permease PerM
MAGRDPVQSLAEGSWSTERIVRLVALAVLAIACIQVVFPFVSALTWGGIIAISVWPAFLWLSRRLGQRPVLAAVACTAALTALLVVPFAWMAASIGRAGPQVARLLGDLVAKVSEVPPDWLGTVPVFGPALDEAWRSAVGDLPGLLISLTPKAEQAGVWALSQGASVALAVLEFLFAIIISGIFLVTADRASVFAERVADRLDIGGGTLLQTVVVTVRSVSFGIVGTAALQAMIATLGYVVAGVPGSGVLGLLTFLIALIQLPTMLVWGLAALWLYVDGQTTPAIGLAIYGGLIINYVDNLLRPWLISRGARLPFSLIFIGVLGGLLAWGIIGLFIGPTFLAVAYSLLVAWLGEKVAAVPPVAGDRAQPKGQ